MQASAQTHPVPAQTGPVPEAETSAGRDLHLGRLQVRMARDRADRVALHALRGRRFRPQTPHAHDEDGFDADSRHLLVQDERDAILATARLRLLARPADFASCYTAQSYDLRALALTGQSALEIGRLCIAPEAGQRADVLRALLAGVTQQAQMDRAQVLLGCASFAGADVARHGAALAWLWAHHAAPLAVHPGAVACHVVRPADLTAPTPEGLRGVPALLRMYLALGAQVSDHAVIDPDLDTLHVLVALPIAAIPPARLRSLQAMAGQGGCL